MTRRSGSADRTGATLLATVVLLLGVVALASRAPLGGSVATLGIGALGRAPRITRSPLGVMLVSGGAVVALFGLFVYQRLQMRLRRKENPLEGKPYRTRWNAQIALIFLPIAVGALIILAGVFGSHPKANLILHHVGFGTVRDSRPDAAIPPPRSICRMGAVVLLGLLITPPRCFCSAFQTVDARP